MASLKLPADLVAFLEASRQLEYDPATCEARKITLLPLKRLKLELFPAYCPSMKEAQKDPHYGEYGPYLVPAVNLVATCRAYQPKGLLLWLPEEGRYGTWDSSHDILQVLAPDVTWTTIVQDPARYINSQWGTGGRNRPSVKSEWLVPWPKYRYSEEQQHKPLPVPKSPFPDLPDAEVRAFLAAIHETPEDDTPRLVFADWLEEHDDPRGEILRIQCTLARMDEDDPAFKECQARDQQWRKRYQKAWNEELGGVVSGFERGLPVAGDDDETGMWLRPARVSGPLVGQLAIGWPSSVWLWITDRKDLATIQSPPWSDAATRLGLVFPEYFPATNARLARLAGLKHIRALGLMDGTMTDAGLAPLAELAGLEDLQLGWTRVGDAGLAHLAGLTRLRDLRLSDTRITDAGLAYLARLRGLKWLDLSVNRVTDAGLAHLVGMTGLKGLYLDGTRITDVGLSQLAGFHNLRVLTLDDTAVTDAGLAHLSGLTRLQNLLVRQTQVTRKGVTRLRKARPGLRVYA
jgi:uncharacterized protein (TIGR02996 family)